MTEVVKSDAPVTKRLFVGGLFPEISEDELRGRFQSFGTITSVDIIKRNENNAEGDISKTFAYVNINGNEKSIQKCISVYSKTKWKGHELKLQIAKESYLSRLKREKEIVSIKSEKTKENSKSYEDINEKMAKTKSTVPGTEIADERNWVVGKYGRALPIVYLRGVGNGKVRKFDPSKHCHQLKKFKDENQGEDQGSIEKLTWSIEEKQGRNKVNGNGLLNGKRRKKSNVEANSDPCREAVACKKTKKNSSLSDDKEQKTRKINKQKCSEDLHSEASLKKNDGRKSGDDEMEIDVDSNDESKLKSVSRISNSAELERTEKEFLIETGNNKIQSKLPMETNKIDTLESKESEAADLVSDSYSTQNGPTIDNGNTRTENTTCNESDLPSFDLQSPIKFDTPMDNSKAKIIRKVSESSNKSVNDVMNKNLESSILESSARSTASNVMDESWRSFVEGEIIVENEGGSSNSKLGESIISQIARLRKEDSSLSLGTSSKINSSYLNGNKHSKGAENFNEASGEMSGLKESWFEFISSTDAKGAKRLENASKGNKNFNGLNKRKGDSSNGESEDSKNTESDDSSDALSEDSSEDEFEDSKGLRSSLAAKSKDCTVESDTSSHIESDGSCDTRKEDSNSTKYKPFQIIESKDSTDCESENSSDSDSEDSTEMESEDSDSTESDSRDSKGPGLKESISSKSKGASMTDNEESKILTDHKSRNPSDSESEVSTEMDSEDSDSAESDSRDCKGPGFPQTVNAKSKGASITDIVIDRNLKDLRSMNSSSGCSSSESEAESDSKNPKKISNNAQNPSTKAQSSKEIIAPSKASLSPNETIKGNPKRRKSSEKQRLKSLSEREEKEKERRNLVKSSLQSVDVKKKDNASNHVKFDSSDEEAIEDDNHEDRKKVEKSYDKVSGSAAVSWLGLGSSDESDSNQEDEPSFSLKPQFEGEQGEKLFKLQQKMGLDKRFRIDERFLDSEDEATDNCGKSEVSRQATNSEDDDDVGEVDLQAEKLNALSILEKVLGKKQSSLVRENRTSNIMPQQLVRYDPLREDHAKYEIQDEAPEDNANKTSNGQEVEHDWDDAQEEKEEEKPPVVSEERFYDVTDSIKDLFQKTDCSTFSFLKNTGDSIENENSQENGGKLEMEPMKESKFQNFLNGDREENMELEETEVVKKEDSKFEKFFFTIDDARLQSGGADGPAAFMRQDSFEETSKNWDERRTELRNDFKKKHKDALRRRKKLTERRTILK